jgi:hypothetical protein
MKPPPITAEDIAALLRFLPLLEELGRPFIARWHGGEDVDGVIQMPFPEYAPDVFAFFWAAGQPCWSDFDYVPAEAAAMLADDECIRNASLEEIRTMLTYCVRGERFSDGFWDAVLRSGRVAALLRRLKELAEEGVAS